MPEREQRPDATFYRYLFSSADIERGRQAYEFNLTNLRIGLKEHFELKRRAPSIWRVMQGSRKR